MSHGNQDGTLQFGFDDSDMVRDPENPKSLHGDSHLSPMEVRDALHPPGGGKSTLRDVSAKIDGKTTIHIRGCDLGQNKEFVNLIDEAFGGKGQVIASTHEQVYGTDTELAKRARAKAKKDIEDSEPMPPPVDPGIKDKAAKRTAMQAREKALKERQARIDQKLKDQKEDIDEAAALAQSYEAMSGVVMQRPGDSKFTEDGSDGRDRTPLPASRQEAARCPRRRRLPRAASGEADLPEFPRQRAHHLRPGLERLRAGDEEGVVRARSEEGRRDHDERSRTRGQGNEDIHDSTTLAGRPSTADGRRHPGQRRHDPARGQDRLAESEGILVGGQARAHRRDA